MSTGDVAAIVGPWFSGEAQDAYHVADAGVVTRELDEAEEAPEMLPRLGVEGEAPPMQESAYGPVEGYVAKRSATATKTDTPIIETPAAIQVVAREVIEDQDAEHLADVVRNVSSVQVYATAGGRKDIFLIRGFQARRIAKDGFLPAVSFGDTARLSLANVERVEVLKGPASVLYGLADPGGLINIVTKKPEIKPHYDFIGKAGSFDLYRGSIDFNRPLTNDGKLLARLNASYRNADSFRDYFIDNERTHIAPSLRWVPTSRTTIDLDLEYYKHQLQMDYGVVAVGGKAPAMPRRHFLGEPGDRHKVEEFRLQGAIEHQFDRSWSLRTLMRFSDTSARPKQTYVSNLAADRRTASRSFFDYDQDYKNYALQANLTGKVKTGPLEHSLLIGVDGNFTRFESTNFIANLNPIDIFNPVYGAKPRLLRALPTQNRRINFYGAYLQDMVSFGDHWKLLIGGRYDIAKTEFERNDVKVTDKRDRHFSPRAGLVFQPVNSLSLYASYTTSFLPPLAGASFNGKPFKPEEGKQYEVGIKRDWFSGQLSTTLAFYRLTRSNVSTPDLQNPRFSIQVGEQRSRGVELDVAGELAPGWRMIGSLAYLDTEITKDNRLPVGNQLANAPYWSSSLWTTYAFQNYPLGGLNIGGGVFVVGDRKADLANRVDVDEYMRIDLFARYKVNKNLNFALNVHNLFNENYIEGAGGGPTALEPGAPRSVFGTVQIHF